MSNIYIPSAGKEFATLEDLAALGATNVSKNNALISGNLHVSSLTATASLQVTDAKINTFKVPTGMGTSGYILSTDGTSSSWIPNNGGNPFDQDLNTTDAVEFASLSVGDSKVGGFKYPAGMGSADQLLKSDGTDSSWISPSSIFGQSLTTTSDPAFRSLSLSGNKSASAWGTSGIQSSHSGATFTNTSSSGTIASTVFNSFARPTLASSSATTSTSAATVYIDGAPIAGTNTTITNPYSLWVAGGRVNFEGDLRMNNALGTGRMLWATGGVLAYTEVTYNGLAVSPNSNQALDLGTASLRWGTLHSSKINASGNISASAWGLNGIQCRHDAATYTDSSTAASGTATNAAVNSFAQPTLAATNASVTTTNAATVYIAGAPTAGTNQTITNAYPLWVDSGISRFDDGIVLMTDCATKPTTDVWSIASDARIKTDIQEVNIDELLAKVNSLKVKTFKYSELYRKRCKITKDEPTIGLIAQEVETVFPSCVNTQESFSMAYVDECKECSADCRCQLHRPLEDLELEELNPVEPQRENEIEAYRAKKAERDAKINEYEQAKLQREKEIELSRAKRTVTQELKDFKTVNKSEIYTALIGAIQALSRRVETLEAAIASS